MTIIIRFNVATFYMYQVYVWNMQEFNSIDVFTNDHKFDFYLAIIFYALWTLTFQALFIFSFNKLEGKLWRFFMNDSVDIKYCYIQNVQELKNRNIGNEICVCWNCELKYILYYVLLLITLSTNLWLLSKTNQI